MRVYIGVGHGGGDYGAIANGLRESEVALDIAVELKRILDEHGIKTKISRETQGTDVQADLNNKIRDCNAFSPDLAVDIHINAGGGNGFEVFHYHKGGVSQKMAKNIDTAIRAAGIPSRGLKIKLNSSGNDYFGWIRSVAAPSIILEAAFIDHAEDVERIRSKNGRHIYALAYAKGILNTLGIPYEENASEAKLDGLNAIYEKYSDIPEFAKPTVKKLMDKGALKGDLEGKLNIPHEILRAYVVNDRMGLYGA